MTNCVCHYNPATGMRLDVVCPVHDGRWHWTFERTIGIWLGVGFDMGYQIQLDLLFWQLHIWKWRDA